MRRTRRGQRWLSVAVLAASVLVLAAAIASEIRYIFWEGDPGELSVGRGAALARGRLSCWRYVYTSAIGGLPPGMFMTLSPEVAEGAGFSVPRGRLSFKCFSYEHGVWGNGMSVDLPLWPAAGAGLVASWFALRGLRRGRAGACGGCGYDLRGVSGGVCPECGAAGATARP